MCVGAKISANERILEKIHEKAHNFGTKVRIFHSSHMFSAEKVSSLTPRLFHLRLRCILNERGIFIVKTMGAWLVYFVDFQQNKCLKN